MTHPDLLLITTPSSPSPADESAARALAESLGLPFAPRARLTLVKLLGRHQADSALVTSEREIRLFTEGRYFGFHPNVAVLRVKALLAGGSDRMIDAAGLEPGDSFLDCTCGLGADAITASFAVGDGGRVRALEASPILAEMARLGMSHYEKGTPDLITAMRRVEVVHADYADVLPALEPDSWDVIYLDPMFEHTAKRSQGLDLVRMLGEPGLPDRAMIDLARRAARRCVVIKDRWPGYFLRDNDIPVFSQSNSVWFGRIEA